MGIEVVTPEDAKKMLEASSKVKTRSNRVVSDDNVAKLLGHIESDEWHAEVNPGIFILSDGFIMNGQHTCTAISKASKPVAVNVVRNANADMMDFFDTGRGRSASDLMTINQVGNSSLKAAGTKILFAYRKKNASYFGKSPLSNHEVYNFYKENEGMNRNVYKSQMLNKEPGIKSSISLAFMYEADPEGKNPEVIEEWFSGLHKNAGLVVNDPRTALMRKISYKKANKARRITREEVIEYIKCWNAWVSDATIANLKVGSKEGIPAILPASNKVLPSKD